MFLHQCCPDGVILSVMEHFCQELFKESVKSAHVLGAGLIDSCGAFCQP
jgi:hypothetical protein